MTEVLKQRLVGLILVVIAGVIFLPDLLDGKKELVKEEFKKIPERPEVAEVPLVSEFSQDEIASKIESLSNKAEMQADDLNTDEVLTSDSNSELAQNTENQVVDQAANVEQTNKEQLETFSKEVDKQDTNAKKPQFESQAWILQLGSFKHKENVDALKNKLTQAGFKTFVKPVETRGGILSKVFVGPELDKNKLLDARKTLKELTGLDGKITQFDPID